MEERLRKAFYAGASAVENAAPQQIEELVFDVTQKVLNEQSKDA